MGFDRVVIFFNTLDKKITLISSFFYPTEQTAKAFVSVAKGGTVL
jgi:hypothetical protein